MANEQKKQELKSKIATGVGIAFCVILGLILIVNCTLLIKGLVTKDRVPMIFGHAPMIVLTDSMVGTFDGGDLIIIKKIEPSEVKVNDIIAFFDPEGSGSSVVTHRVEGIPEKDGKIYFNTKGDANASSDKVSVPEENLIGIYTDFRIPNAGHVAMFMQTTWGLIICVIAPIVLMIGIDAIRRARYNKQHDEDKDKLLAELEELRKLKAEKESEETKDNKS